MTQSVYFSLRVLFARQSKGWSGEVDKILEFCLKWWRDVLALDIAERRPWRSSDLAPCNLFVDARSTPPRIAAVLECDGLAFYSDVEPGADVLQFFTERKDHQITSLELLALAFGLSTFGEKIRGRRVRIYSDNHGAECSVRPVTSVLSLVALACMRRIAGKEAPGHGTIVASSIAFGCWRQSCASRCSSLVWPRKITLLTCPHVRIIAF